MICLGNTFHMCENIQATYMYNSYLGNKILCKHFGGGLIMKQVPFGII